MRCLVALVTFDMSETSPVKIIIGVNTHKAEGPIIRARPARQEIDTLISLLIILGVKTDGQKGSLDGQEYGWRE